MFSQRFFFNFILFFVTHKREIIYLLNLRNVKLYKIVVLNYEKKEAHPNNKFAQKNDSITKKKYQN